MCTLADALVPARSRMFAITFLYEVHMQIQRWIRPRPAPPHLLPRSRMRQARRSVSGGSCAWRRPKVTTGMSRSAAMLARPGNSPKNSSCSLPPLDSTQRTTQPQTTQLNSVSGIACWFRCLVSVADALQSSCSRRVYGNQPMDCEKHCLSCISLHSIMVVITLASAGLCGSQPPRAMATRGPSPRLS